MSIKSSRSDGGSYTSSAGETRSFSSSSSSGRRRRRAAEPRAPPQMMNAIERLQLVRNAVSRMKATTERQRQSAALTIDGVDENVKAQEHAVFEKLRTVLPKLEYNPRRMGDAASGPQFIPYVAREAEKLTVIVNDAVNAVSAHTSSAAAYDSLHHHFLLSIQHDLDELKEVVTHKPAELKSRLSTQLLDDLVAIHIHEFDMLMDSRIPHYINECLRESGYHSSAVRGGSSSSGDSSCGLFSAVVLGMAVGVRPGRSARMVMEHAKHIILELSRRLEAAEVVLRDTAKADRGLDPAASRLRVEQSSVYSSMRTRVTEGLATVESAKLRWKDMEQNIFTKALGGEPLQELLQVKRIQEEEVIHEVQEAHDIVVHACLPFASPQYHRRYGLTYSQPAHVQLGFRFRSTEGNGATLMLPTFMPEFYSLCRLSPEQYLTYASLVPSSEEIWVPLGELPEMVRGTRCALRRVSHREYPRAMEEQKETGGYFIMGGGERILRSLIMQRTNVGINIERDKFSSQGKHFSSKAVVLRCKRPSGLTCVNYFYYATNGQIIFSFTRKTLWQIPLLLLLSSVNVDQLSSLSLYHALTLGMSGAKGAHGARVEALLQHHRSQPYAHLTSHLDYLAVLGEMYRQYHESSGIFSFLPDFAKGAAAGQHDAWYGLFMLRRHVLPHLNVAEEMKDLSPKATEAEKLAWLSPALLTELRKKFDALLAMARQLYSFVDGTSSHQGNDVPAYQEVITVSQVLIGALEVCLHRFLRHLTRVVSKNVPPSLFRQVMQLPTTSTKDGSDVLRQIREHSEHALRGISSRLSVLTSLLTTGNFALDHEEDFYCPQTAGFVVMAEHLNFFRFFEQLRCIHRGQTIAQMRSSEVRKYPPESYGFICMVHSPDGEDCGVSNYLSISTIFSSSLEADEDKRELARWVQEELPHLVSPHRMAVEDKFIQGIPVWLEGEVIGYTTPAEAEKAAKGLRQRKEILRRRMVDPSGYIYRKTVKPLHTLEVVYIPVGGKDPAGLFLFADCGRLMRPVQVLDSASAATSDLPFPLSFIGTWEQSWLNIASVAADLPDAQRHLGKTYDYMEVSGDHLISFTSTTIPFFEYNCSPRNLFQCGLSKQSSGTQLQALMWRKEAKLFRTYAPQRYISRTTPMDTYQVDDVNLGVNAVVATLAYTGYDMDDAVILNHCASQRGMLNAGVTVAKIIRASGMSTMGKKDAFVFHNMLSTGDLFSAELNANGLPPSRLVPTTDSFTFERDHQYPALRDTNDVYCCALRQERTDPLTNQPIYEYTRHKTTKWRHFDKGEDAWVHKVVPLEFNGPDPVSALVIFRIPRPPTIGDKFSSRHGQKGTLPLHIRSFDLPFSTVSGITPDVIINPHAFPSRMTVGMVLETMVGKVGAVQGRFIDNSAWSVVDDTPMVAAEVGEVLANLGYNRYGRESMVDGISGEVMEADVFVGIAGYQRLRHQVSDKWQARARTDAHRFRAVTKTGQPVKGRKHHGGVRVGEMERDALLSHGISEVVLDRLLHVSDSTRAFICPSCGDILSIYERHATEYATWRTCRFCGCGEVESTDQISLVNVPQVLRLWAAELTSIGIRVALKTSDVA